MSSRNRFWALAVTVGPALAASCSANDLPTSIVEDGIAPVTPVTPVTPSGQRTRKGFIWSREAGLQVIPLPPNATSMDVTAMNNEGQVVGYVTRGEGTENYRAFTWSAAQGYKALGSLAGPEGISRAYWISDAGEVTGLSEGPATNLNGPMGISLGDYFSWTAESGMRAIGKPGFAPELMPVSAGGKLSLPAGTECADVAGSNDKGQAIGYAGRMSSAGCRFTVAILWNTEGQPVQIAECGSRPWCGTALNDINNRGEVVGYRESLGFRWTAENGFVWMPMPNTMLRSINDLGDAAGAVGTGEVLTPVVWKASGDIIALQLPTGGRYGYPVAINQQGQVAGSFN